MYPSKHYQEQDELVIQDLIADNPLASLVFLNTKKGIELCHIPLVLDSSGKVLLGHMVANNPLAKQLAKTPSHVTCIFNGSDSYISPKDAQEVTLPSWHYAKVEIRGLAKPISCKQQKLDVMHKCVAHFESQLKTNWQLSQGDPKLIDQLFKYIMVFSIDIESQLGNFKLSQDKSPETRAALKESLQKRGKHSAAQSIY